MEVTLLCNRKLFWGEGGVQLYSEQGIVNGLSKTSKTFHSGSVQE